ncbi:MAG: alpha/beta fold hydrolase [Deltaproteobacteria bacterium]|nr:alpha/beta fold hydrolase [Deltaproteobacteria bacterium]
MIPEKLKPNGRQWWIIGIISGIGLAAYMILIPWDITGLLSHSHPARTYAEALRRVKVMRADEPQGMNPACRLQLMTHDKKMPRAIILVHGYTSCPRQFHRLGRKLYDLGYNVLIAPLPHHGLADRMTEAHAKLRAEEMVTYADDTVDIAQGLGRQVVMMGLSAGGVITAWAAQNRSDIKLAVIISPSFGFKKIPSLLTAAAMNIHMLLPDSFIWKDQVLREKVLPRYDYPRYSMHALAQILRLGFATQAAARRAPPTAGRIVVVTNANDNTVNNALTMDLVKSWQARSANVTTYEFAADLNLGHDLIDPNQPNQKIDIVYPRLIDLLKL